MRGVPASWPSFLPEGAVLELLFQPIGDDVMIRNFERFPAHCGLLLACVLVLQGVLVSPALAAGDEMESATRLTSRGWQTIEGRVNGSYRGAALYQSKVHTPLDMLRVTLYYPYAPFRVGNKWLDLSDGTDALFRRYLTMVENYSRRRDEAGPHGAVYPEGPPLVQGAFDICEGRGIDNGSRNGRKQLAACMFQEVLGPAELRVMALFSKGNVIHMDGSGKRRVVRELSALRVTDMTNGNSEEIVRLPRGKMCTSRSGRQLCASCRESFTALASGRRGNMPCGSDDALLAISARFSYPGFVRSAIEMEDPRLTFVFRDMDGKDYEVRYRTDGLLKALTARDFLKP